ncbi:hypothetical protein HRbin36_02506 [bacterium HR36]|nr:hypothetical protein HRbin36_02506 [bacterium HR36]
MLGLHRSWLRRCLAALLILGQMLWVTGVPGSWLGLRWSKDHRVPFPCMNRSCACRNAQDCWQHCCCFSPAERLAWARKHGLSVAQIVPADWPNSQCSHACEHTGEGPEQLPAKCCGSCSTKDTDSCCEARAGRRLPCRGDTADAESAHACGSPAEETQAAPSWYHPILLQRCRGELTVWWTQLLALPEWVRPEPGLISAFPEDKLCLKRRVRACWYCVPEDPPPRTDCGQA